MIANETTLHKRDIKSANFINKQALIIQLLITLICIGTRFVNKTKTSFYCFT